MDVWVAGDDVKNSVKDLIAQYHPHLAPFVDQIAIVFREKHQEAGDIDIVGKTSKAPSLLGVLSETDWKFVITLAADIWEDMSNAEQMALLDHHLCACRVEEKKDGSARCYLQPPDVSFYKEEVERHGMWRTSKVPPSPNLIQELFGGD